MFLYAKGYFWQLLYTLVSTNIMFPTPSPRTLCERALSLVWKAWIWTHQQPRYYTSQVHGKPGTQISTLSAPPCKTDQPHNSASPLQFLRSGSFSRSLTISSHNHLLVTAFSATPLIVKFPSLISRVCSLSWWSISLTHIICSLNSVTAEIEYRSKQDFT